MKTNLKVQQIQIQNITQKTISILGGKGCGKSTLLNMIGNSLYCPCIIIDPIGSKSIKNSSFENLTITQPLNNDIIKWIKEQWTAKKTILINGSLFAEDEFITWCNDFFAITWRDGVIIVDEVHYIVPQQRGKYSLKFQSFSKKCRNDNCGLILSSQRPQSVNKETLALSDTFLIGRTMYHNDREITINLVKPFIEKEEIEGIKTKIQSLPFLSFIILDYRRDQQ